MMNVYFTVDTESSMAGAWLHADRRPLKSDRHIFCRIGDRDYGVGLITDILSEYGFRATYFVETLITLVNGVDDSRAVFDFLLKREQDVQLHIHPTYLLYADWLRMRARNPSYQPPTRNDLLSRFDEDRQQELIQQATILYERFTGKRPLAFRAGCFAANSCTLRCLRRAGVLFDSSFNPCYREWSFPNEALRPNHVCNIEGIWEVPVTVARTPLPEGYGGLKHADPSSLSVAELRAMLETGAQRGQEHFVIVFHSFSAVKTKDDTYRQIRPDQIVIRRLERLVRYLNERRDLYRVTTFGDVASDASSLGASPHPVTDLRLSTAAVRKSIQGLNRWYWL